MPSWQGGEGELDEVILNRWLKAENYNVEQAEKRLRAHAIWRQEEFPEGRVLEVTPPPLPFPKL